MSLQSSWVTSDEEEVDTSLYLSNTAHNPDQLLPMATQDYTDSDNTVTMSQPNPKELHTPKHTVDLTNSQPSPSPTETEKPYDHHPNHHQHINNNNDNNNANAKANKNNPTQRNPEPTPAAEQPPPLTDSNPNQKKPKRTRLRTRKQSLQPKVDLSQDHLSNSPPPNSKPDPNRQASPRPNPNPPKRKTNPKPNAKPRRKRKRKPSTTTSSDSDLSPAAHSDCEVVAELERLKMIKLRATTAKNLRCRAVAQGIRRRADLKEAEEENEMNAFRELLSQTNPPPTPTDALRPAPPTNQPVDLTPTPNPNALPKASSASSTDSTLTALTQRPLPATHQPMDFSSSPESAVDLYAQAFATQPKHGPTLDDAMPDLAHPLFLKLVSRLDSLAQTHLQVKKFHTMPTLPLSLRYTPTINFAGSTKSSSTLASRFKEEVNNLVLKHARATYLKLEQDTLRDIHRILKEADMSRATYEAAKKVAKEKALARELEKTKNRAKTQPRTYPNRTLTLASSSRSPPETLTPHPAAKPKPAATVTAQTNPNPPDDTNFCPSSHPYSTPPFLPGHFQDPSQAFLNTLCSPPLTATLPNPPVTLVGPTTTIAGCGLVVTTTATLPTNPNPSGVVVTSPDTYRPLSLANPNPAADTALSLYNTTASSSFCLNANNNPFCSNPLAYEQYATLPPPHPQPITAQPQPLPPVVVASDCLTPATQDPNPEQPDMREQMRQLINRYLLPNPNL